MSADATLVFTALPNPARVTPLRLTVMVNPRLQAGGNTTLGAFDLGDRPWPAMVASMSLTVRLGTVELTAPPAPPRRAREALDPTLWQRLFPSTTPVVPRRLDRDRRPIVSYPAAEVARHIHDIYRAVAATSSRELPPVVRKTSPEGEPAVANPIDLFVDDLAQVDHTLMEIACTEMENDSDALYSLSPRARAFYRAKRFYLRRSVDQDVPPLDDGPVVPVLDFHQRVAMLADHPTLLRRLGLVFDIELPPEDRWPASGLVQVLPNWTTGPRRTAMSPSTAYRRTPDRFLTAPVAGSTSQRDGYLSLDANHEVLQVDVDGAALQSVDFAANVRREMTELTMAPIGETGMPALRTGGLTVVRTGRADWLEGRRQRTDELVRSAAVVLDADDVLRGYRIDVDDGSGTWRSLCRRVGTITAGGTAPITIGAADDEEGYVKAASGTSTPGRDELYLHEAVAGWDGWSLCARRPGRAVEFVAGRVEPDGTVVPPREAIVVGTPTSHPDIDVHPDYRVTPGSLPALRFGRSYRLRARAVDIAGNSLPHTDRDTRSATAPIVYQRYEPVPAPVLVLPAPITEGESLEHLVVRSTLTAEQYVVAAREQWDLASRCSRHVVAPKCTLAVAEAHGMLDAAFAPGADPVHWYHVARKEAGTLLDRTVVDLATGEDRGDDVHLELCNPLSSLRTEAPSDPRRRGDPLGNGEYVTHTGTEIRIPWLPDPLADALVLRDAAPDPRSFGDAVVTLPFPATPVPGSSALASWPDKQSLRVVAVAFPGNRIVRNLRAVTGGDDRTAIYWLPPGHQITLRYSSRIAENRLREMAVWNLLDDAQRATVGADARAGLHWMLSPPRELRMVHAVQHPVTPPRLDDDAAIERALGETSVRFFGSIASHGWSTSHVDVRAAWQVLIDDPASDAPRFEARSGDAFRVAIPYGEAHSSMRYTGVAEYRAVNSGPVDHLETQYDRTIERDPRHELGDTRHLQVTYTPVATSRYQEYFPAEVIADRRNLETEGVPFPARVPSTARPAAPAVLYAVPTFRWENLDGRNGRRRVGNGLRIYLDRPWFSSGDGERLAVLLGDERVAALRPYVSAWGRDPAWQLGGPAPLGDGHVRGRDDQAQWFPSGTPDARVRIDNVALATGHTVTAVGLMPQWNAERKLWYADLELDAEATYAPFVSLALARWQPDSVRGAELSPVVRCQFIQLAPDRTATVVRSGNQVEVRLSGAATGNAVEGTGGRDGTAPREASWWWVGPTHAGTSDAGRRVQIRLEHRPPGAADHDLAWRTIAGPIEVRSTWNWSNGEAVWTGVLPVGTPPPGPLRVVVTEAEVYESDPNTAGDPVTSPTTPVDLGGWIRAPTIKTGRERIVYLDTLEI